MPRFSHLLIVCLALVALALGAVVWLQRVDLQRLTRAHAAQPSVARASRGAATPAPRIATAPRHDRGAPVWVEQEEEGLARFSPALAPVTASSAVARLLNDPAFLQALAVHQEGALDARFAPLFRRLKLTADELAAFKRLLVEKDNAILDVAAVTQEVSGPPLSPQAVQASVHAAQAEVENAIRRSLGEDRYVVYSDYVNTLPQRATVRRLEQRLSYTEAPLQPAQAETLVAILAQHPAPETHPPMSAALSALPAEPVPLAPPSPLPAAVSPTALAQAHTVLSPTQVSALSQIQVEMQAAAQAAALAQRNLTTGDLAAGADASWLRFLLQ